MIQAQFFLQLEVVAFDLAPALGDAHLATQCVVRGQIAEEVLDRLFLRFRPLHRQLDFLLRRISIDESVGRLHPQSEEA